MTTPMDRQPYFQRPVMLMGIVLLVMISLYGRVLDTREVRRSGLAATVTADKASGKAVNPYGAFTNPVPLSIPYFLSSARLQVNSFQRDMSAAVEQMSSFNRDPNLQEEWVIFNITYFCDRPAGQTCSTYALDFELQGQNRTYNDNFVVLLDDQFTGSVAGGEQLTGNIGFITRRDESDLLLVVTDAEQRVYFQVGSGGGI